MESVGLKLRQARLRLGLTLEDVSAITRINIKNLSAIEADEVDHISSRFIYKSFVRQIATAVGIPSESVEETLAAAAEAIPEALFPGQTGAPRPPKLASLRPQRTRISRWIYSTALLVGMLVACSTLYAMWQDSRIKGTASIAVPTLTVATASSKPASTPKTVVPPAQTDSPFKIELAAVDQAWISVSTDGKEVYNGTLHPRETKTLEGHETARIRTGNAGGVEVSFNGRNLGPLGTKGQVRTVVFNRNGYEVLGQQAGIIAGDQAAAE